VARLGKIVAGPAAAHGPACQGVGPARPGNAASAMRSARCATARPA